MATQAQLAAVQQLYVGYLGRAADAEGQKFWADAIANGTATIASVATGFTLSAEYQAAYAGLDSAALVDKIYTNVLGRAADAEGKAFWVAALANGTVAADTLLATMITNLGALDQQTINNKVFVAQTYTDTAGASYNPTAGAASIVGVDSTAASVAAATAKIAGGSLAGQVPGEGLVNALAAAQTAEAGVQTGNTAAVNALVTKLAANVAAGTPTDLITGASTYAQKVTAITTDAGNFRTAVSTDSTGVLTTKANEAAAAVETARALLTADAKTKAATYEAAVKTNAGLTAAKLADVTGVKAGLAVDPAFTPTVLGKATAVDGSITDAAKLYDFYVASTTTAAQRTALDTALKDVPYLATFKATASVDVAKNAAILAESTAKAAIDAADGIAVGPTEFSALVTAKATTADTLVKAQAADADVAAVKAITDANKVANDATVKAGAAIAAFNSDPANVANNVKIAAVATGDASATVKETFYFADKVGLNAGTDYTIGTGGVATQFGAGDSIVLGSGYTFNSGALSTGNNNALEFFLVKSDAGVQIVVESTVAGSTNATVSATAGVTTTAGATDTTSVITLTGVTLDHLSVANGVVSYV